MKILTASQMREVDRATIEQHGVPGVALMENAGTAVVRAIEHRHGPLAEHRYLILCGKGNNGGDGFVVARQLLLRGLRPQIVLLADPGAIQGEARSHYELLLRAGGRPSVVTGVEEWRALRPEVEQATLIIDAILGTGLTGPVKGLTAEVVRDVNADFAHLPLVAVDMPTGVPSDTGEPAGEALRATTTVTFTAPKVGQIFPPNCEHLGELVVSPIGTPPAVVEERRDAFLNLITPSDLEPFTRPRARGAHKGDFGHVLLVAGSRGKTGAAAMAGVAALRIGAGLVTVATAESAQNAVAGYQPELMTEALPETDSGAISAQALEYGRFDKVARGKDVLAAGPGLGQHPDTVSFVRRLVGAVSGRSPTVLDADALNAFAGGAQSLGEAAARDAVLVLTPHPGEMARLAGITTAAVQKDRVGVARGFATRNRVFVVLKGYRTLIAAPDGQVWVCTTGNPGMAKGGTGDVLTGFIAGMLAQFSEQAVVSALCAAVYIHGLAGDIAAAETGDKSLLATDMTAALPKVWRRLHELVRGG